MSTIVVGVDPSDESKEALHWALEEARLRGARLVALHAWSVPPTPIVVDVVPVPPPIDLPALIVELRTASETLLDVVVEEVVGEDAGVEVERVSVEGLPASTLMEAARDADLLVVGSRGHGGFAGLLLGSVSLQGATHAPCPVVIHRRASSR
jgi:nucleotide-binding universal stress UspA family protein